MRRGAAVGLNGWAVPAVLSAAYWLLASFACRKRSATSCRAFTPPISILKPVKGRDERFFESIRSHARQDYPAFEILFGVRDPHDPALTDIQALISESPHIPIRIISKAPETANGKVGMLIALAAAARFPTLLVNDSDILVDPDYLRTVAGPLENPGVGMVTCLYRARGGSFPARFEALGIAVSFAPSLLVARFLGVVEFALGSTMVFRAEQLHAIGGFEAIGDYLADDYQLGARIAATGHRVVLADCPVETNLGAGSWRDVWKHQVRWSRTVRVSRPGGYAGSIVTHATLWSLVALASGAWHTALACFACRMLGALMGARAVQQRQTAWHLVPLRDLFESAVWMAGLFGNTVEWRGETLTLSRDGRIRHTLV